MKNGITGFLFLTLASVPCLAQEQKGIEVPFLPYVQMTGTGAVTDTVNPGAATPFDRTTRSQKRVSTVFFDSESATTLRKQDLPTLKAVASRVVPENRSVRLVGYRTSKMSQAIVNDRLQAVANALQDLGVTRILFASEVRKNNVISVNRVDIFEL